MKQNLITTLEPLICHMIKKIPKGNFDFKECSWPFMPYIGPEYQNADIKILIVGKATMGWGFDNPTTCPNLINENNEYKGKHFEEKFIEKPHFFKDLLELTDNFINNCVIPYYKYYKGNSGYNSRFWQRIDWLVPTLINKKPSLPEYSEYKKEPTQGEQSERCFKSIAWTNTFKIGTANGNPSGPLIKSIKDECKEMLKTEVEILKPNIILFSTGVTYDRYLEEFFDIKINGNNKGIVPLHINNFGGIAFRTTHFQRLSNEEAKNLYNDL